MTPPSPSLSFSWRGDGPKIDPALDDTALVRARDSLAQGRWSDSRALLAATGEDGERRGHRLAVLAGAPSAEAWARDWLLTEPGTADAAALLAFAAVHVAVRDNRHPDAAREAVTAAARLAPTDPAPRLAALLLARHSGGQRGCRVAFEALTALHPEHHHAHHVFAAVLAEDAKEHVVYDFAQEAAATAPPGSRLALLPLVAHAEVFRVRVAAGSAPDPAEHWAGRRARHFVRIAFDWWLKWGAEDTHPRRMIDLNFLAHAKFHEGRLAEAAALFQRVDPHVTAAPWSYGGGSPRQAFRAARDATYGPS